MIAIFFGEDRVKAQGEIKRMLGEDYEVAEGAELDLNAVRDVFLGTSLFGARKIVVKDLLANKGLAAEDLLELLKTEHQVVLWEEKLDKRTVLYRELSGAGVEMREFKLVKPAQPKVEFDILETALRGDGARAVKLCGQIEEEEPYRFVGLMVSQAVRNFSYRQGTKEKRVLRELSKLDMQMKGDSNITSPWILVKAFLLRVSSP